MSLAIAFKGPEGIVLAADSRVTLTTQVAGGDKILSYFDNATKLLRLAAQPYVGIVTYGMGAIGTTGPRTAHSFLPEFEAELAASHPERATVAEIAQAVSDFYAQQWQQAGMPPAGTPDMQPMVFQIAGFDEGDAYGKVYEVSVPTALAPAEKNANDFGLTFGGQIELVSRLISGVDQRAGGILKDALNLDDTQVNALDQRLKGELGIPIPFQFLPLQDCVDLSTFLVYMTSVVQGWTIGVRGVGGDVDVATITRTEGFQAIRQKQIRPWE